MTSAAVVLPDAAVRAVAGRRALQVVLLLAGLLALGFLCGERAQAADGLPAPDRVESARSADASAEPMRETARAAHTTVREAPGELAAGARAGADAAGPVVRGVHDVAVDGVVRPVVDEVTGLLAAGPERVLPDMPELPRPGTGLGDGEDADGGTGADAPDSAADSRGGQSEANARAHEGRKSHGARAGSSYGHGHGHGHGDGDAYFVGRLTRGDGFWGGDLSGSAPRGGHEPLPLPGGPVRTLGGPSAGDGGSTRHGDPCAASGDSRAPVRLLAGAGASQVSASLRDRHRDIPEFPG
ncbi:hypothetical protein [Streptomyces sp. MZ04]|uniref:hypothetical protein n=1 Tax=Streptomyces sp. MZ04 TaxID=2559236 RepID=UPI00107E699E|nr:hypothetical protein [Streptomyces sp. MZ04]TGA90323.1 hypothetical protein E2651_38765 [Streptomyces sp. MZ04]